MAAETDTRLETRKLTILDIVVIAFLGLTGVGLASIGIIGWFVVVAMARDHGGSAGGLNILLPAMAVGGFAQRFGEH